MKLDKTDCRILEILQNEGRITNLELAERVNLSPTPCAMRVKKLETSGVISRYAAIVDPVAAGLPITAFVLIKISDNTREAANNFATAIAELPSVVECNMTAGKLDYIVRVVARDLTHYEEIIKDHLGSLPNVTSMETMFVLNKILHDRNIAFAGGLK